MTVNPLIFKTRKSDESKKAIKKICNLLPENSKVIEIGSYAGECTELFLKSKKISEIFCIDPYENYFDNNDLTSHICSMSLVEKEFDRKIKLYSSDFKIHKIKDTSEHTSNQFENNSIDLVYIDGLHTYEGFKSDIKNYFWKVKKFGYIGGHDFNNPRLPDVTSSILIQIGKVPTYIFPDYNWICVKH